MDLHIQRSDPDELGTFDHDDAPERRVIWTEVPPPREHPCGRDVRPPGPLGEPVPVSEPGFHLGDVAEDVDPRLPAARLHCGGDMLEQYRVVELQHGERWAADMSGTPARDELGVHPHDLREVPMVRCALIANRRESGRE